MGSKLGIALYVISMVALIVALDVLVFKDQFWERLAVNIGIVLVYGAVYFLFLRRS
jgi:xanthine/uracil permease